MKFSTLFLCLCLLFTLSALPQAAYAQNAPQFFTPGQDLKSLHFTTTDAVPYALSDLQEPVILLHYWASWCPPCVVEFPKLLETVREMNGQVALVAVSLDREAGAMQRYIDTLDTQGLPIYWVYDSNYDLSYRQHRILGTPETIFIGPQRTVIKKVNDEYDWRAQESWKELTAMIAGSM